MSNLRLAVICDMDISVIYKKLRCANIPLDPPACLSDLEFKARIDSVNNQSPQMAGVDGKR